MNLNSLLERLDVRINHLNSDDDIGSGKNIITVYPEVDKWYLIDWEGCSYPYTVAVYVSSIVDNGNSVSGVGFDRDGRWIEAQKTNNWHIQSTKWVEADTDRIFSLLTQEAKGRGFKIGCTVKREFASLKETKIRDIKTGYQFNNKLYLEGVCIYSKGVWAKSKTK